MIPLLASPPRSIWYTFNFVSGYFVDAEGFRWQPNNPTYDPGPPPPPRPPREPKNTSTETSLQEGEDVSVITKHVPTSKRKYGGILPQGARERWPDQMNVAPPGSNARSPGSVSQSHASGHHTNYPSRQGRHQHKNLHMLPVQDSSSQVPFQRFGSNVHHQRIQHHNMPYHPSFVGSNTQTRLQPPDGTYIHPPRPQHRNAILHHPHPPPSQTLPPQLQASSAFRTMPSRNVPLSGGSPSDPPSVTTPQSHSGPVYVNSIPRPRVNLPRSRAR